MNLKAMILAGALLSAPLFAADNKPAAAPAPAAPQQIQNAAPAAAPAGKVKKSAEQPKKNGSKSSKKSGWLDMLPMIIMIVVVIFLFSRSNKKQQQKRQQMLDRIVKGTRVMLNSGVYGKIAEVKEKAFVVEIAENVKIEVIKNGIASVEDEEEAKKDDPAKKDAK